MAVSPPPSTNGVAPVEARKRDLRKEFVSAGSTLTRPYSGRTLKTLPHPLDDLSADLGLDIYRRMLLDPQVNACVTLMKAAILEDGITLAPSITDAEHDDYKKAVEVRDEAMAMLDRLETPLDEVLWNMADAMAYGSKVAEKVYALRPGLDGDRKFQLIRLKPKAHNATSFVVDDYLNVIGFAVNKVNSPYSTTALDRADLLPPEKFIWLSWHPVNGDPRGTSLLRPAYNPWWRKNQIIPEYLRYLAQFAGPSLWATTAEGAQLPPAVDPLGNPDPDAPTPQTPEQVLLDTLLQFQTSTAAAFPYGTLINLIQSAGDGAAFISALSGCNQEMTKAILTQELATEQSRNQARAAAQVHQDVLETLIRQGKKAFARMIQRQILLPWVLFNYGADSEILVPIPSLGTTEEQDLPQLIRAFAAAWAAGMIAPSQLPHIDGRLGLPVRDLTKEPPPEPNQPTDTPGEVKQPGEPSGPEQNGTPPEDRPSNEPNKQPTRRRGQ